MFAVFDDASQNIQNATGPIDDGYITNVVGALPGDALCCAGPEPLDDGEFYRKHTCVNSELSGCALLAAPKHAAL